MNEGQFLWLLVLTLGQVSTLVVNLYSLRRKPPVIEELYQQYLRSDDHSRICEGTQQKIAGLDAHNVQTHKEIFDVIRTNQAAVQADFKTLERGLGRVEGKLEKIIGGDKS